MARVKAVMLDFTRIYFRSISTSQIMRAATLERAHNQNHLGDES
jgi:hypothetical protein